MLTPQEQACVDRWRDPNPWTRGEPFAQTHCLTDGQLAHAILLSRLTFTNPHEVCGKMASVIDDLKVQLAPRGPLPGVTFVVGNPDMGPAGEQIKRQFVERADCALPPEGWRCTREPGHAGPCAAIPDDRQPYPTGEPLGGG